MGQTLFRQGVAECEGKMFAGIEFVGPPVGMSPPSAEGPDLRVAIAGKISLPSPLIAYDLPWHRCPPTTCQAIAEQLDRRGISVAGLRSELQWSAAPDQKLDRSGSRLAICPYRPDRFGLQIEDLLGAQIIDIRLHAIFDQHGLPLFDASLLRRWDQRSAQIADRAEELYGGMRSVAWPPDVASWEKIAGKVSQLRSLAPQAAMAISIDARRLPQALAPLADTSADLIGIFAEQWPLEQTEVLVRLIAEAIDHFAVDPSRSRPSLFVVPPAGLTVVDCLKLLALGVKLVAIDGWCHGLLEPTRQTAPSAAQWAATALGVSTEVFGEKEAAIDLRQLDRALEELQLWGAFLGINAVENLNRDFLVSYRPGIPGIKSLAAPRGASHDR